MLTRNEISAGGVVFRERDSGGFDVALIRTHEGRWQLPKGWVEEGEEHAATAVREVREEAGVEAEVVGPLDTIEYWYKSTYDPEPVRVHKHVHMYLLRYIAGTTDDHDDEVTEARFVDIDEAGRMLAFKDEQRMMAMASDLLRQIPTRELRRLTMPDATNIPPMRGPVLATHGMVASEHPLVSQTGVDVLRSGGNAFDAALAMSALLPVVKPARSHLGGDAYILVYSKAESRITAICSGGKAPAAATLDFYRDGIPQHGGAAAAIPGLVDAWQVVSDRWCTRPLADLVAPAVAYARDGFPVSRELSLVLNGARGLFTKYAAMQESLYIDGGSGSRPPMLGEILRQPALADVIESIGRDGRRAFYEGPLAERISSGVRDAGGCMTAGDLASHSADVLDPLSVQYRGDTVYETPPNSQGLILLEQLAILAGYDLAAWPHLSPDAVHHMVEAKKLAFEDRQCFAGDRAFVDFDPARLLTEEWAAERRAQIEPDRARTSTAPVTTTDTTSFVVADGAGNVCSFIQSVFAPFGSAVAIPGTGIIMNNRMRGFSLEPGHPNVLAPAKRTMHTLNTYIVFRGGAPYLVGNTPGADFQVQTNLQVITGILDYGLDPQAAIDAPRWGDAPQGLLIEEEMPPETQRDLARRGHDVRPVSRVSAPMGRAQAIVIDPATGVMTAGSDARGEGAAMGW